MVRQEPGAHQRAERGAAPPVHPYGPGRPARPAETRRGSRSRPGARDGTGSPARSEEHTSELQSLIRTSSAVFCLTKKNNKTEHPYLDKIARHIIIHTNKIQNIDKKL